MRIESSKSEIRNPKQIRMFQCQKPRTSRPGSGPGCFEHCFPDLSNLFRFVQPDSRAKWMRFRSHAAPLSALQYIQIFPSREDFPKGTERRLAAGYAPPHVQSRLQAGAPFWLRLRRAASFVSLRLSNPLLQRRGTKDAEKSSAYYHVFLWLWSRQARISDFGFRFLTRIAAVFFSPRLFAFSKTQVVDRAKIPALRPPMDLMPPSFWEQHGGLVAAGTVAALGAAALLFWLLRRARPVVVTPPDVAARQALEALRDRAEDGRVVAEISRNLRLYVRAAFLQQSDELTTEELLAALGRLAPISPELTPPLSELLRECDARRFAPIPPPAPLALVPRALELVARLESVRQQISTAPVAGAS